MAMTIRKSVLQSYLRKGNPIEEVLETAEEAIENGEEVLIQDDLNMDPPATVLTIETEDQLEKWAQQFFIDPDEVYLCTGEHIVAPVEDLTMEGGDRPVKVVPTLSGRVLKRGKKNPTIVSFSVEGMISEDRRYYLYNSQEGTLMFYIEQMYFDGQRTHVKGIKLE